MPDIQKLKELSIDDLLQELRAREANARTTGLAVAVEPSEGLREFDDRSIVTILKGKQKGIYGVDDRVDVFQLPTGPNLDDVDSVVALFEADDIVDNGNGSSTLNTVNFGVALNLCPGEPFANQPAGRGARAGEIGRSVGCFCSGFLVARDVIATAGHCVDPGNVTNVRFVFGFRMRNATTAATVIANADIYRGVSIIGRQQVGTGADWALVRLDRAVTNHRIAGIRRTGRIGDTQAVHVIGHPVGLPTKFAGGAAVRDNQPPAFFVANLDTYGGNSGSPVFNSNTHQVEGILVRGDTDFVSQGSCQVSMVCPDTGCGGEDCTRTTEFARLILRPIWIGNFSRPDQAEVLTYDPGDDNWWLGTHDGSRLKWTLAGNTAGFGHGINDGRPFWIGNFSRSDRAEVLTYYPGDGNWWLGSHDGSKLQWTHVGNTMGANPGDPNFGQVWDGRPFWIGNFSRSDRAEVLTYYPGDDNWWLGTHDGSRLKWTLAGNTAGFGHGINDGRPFWIGNFSRSDRAEVLTYYPGDGNWWLGSHDGSKLQWTHVGNTMGANPGDPNFGQVWDGRPFWIGNFSRSDRAEVLTYYPGDDNWWLGTHDGSRLKWTLAGNTAGFGHGINDGRPFWIGNFSRSDRAEVLTYYPGDGNWWLGSHDGSKLQWTHVGNTMGANPGDPNFGQVWDGRPFWIGNFSRSDRAEVLTYYPGDGNWWLGSHQGAGGKIRWSHAGNIE